MKPEEIHDLIGSRLAQSGASIQEVLEVAKYIIELNRDAERYRFLKSRIEVPGAVAHFLRLNNWNPATDLRDVDAALDEAMSIAAYETEPKE